MYVHVCAHVHVSVAVLILVGKLTRDGEILKESSNLASQICGPSAHTVKSFLSLSSSITTNPH